MLVQRKELDLSLSELHLPCIFTKASITDNVGVTDMRTLYDSPEHDLNLKLIWFTFRSSNANVGIILNRTLRGINSRLSKAIKQTT